MPTLLIFGLFVLAPWQAQGEPRGKALLACYSKAGNGQMAPVCGVPNAKGGLKFRNQKTIWEKKILTWGLRSAPPSGWTTEDIRSELTESFKAWSDVCGIKFEESRDAMAPVDIIVTFNGRSHAQAPETDDTDPPLDGPGGILAHAFFPGPQIGGDCHFDASEPWCKPGQAGIIFRSTAIHELGHVLGLDHNDSDPSSIMRSAYTGSIEIASSDRRKVEAFYGKSLVASKVLASFKGNLDLKEYTREFQGPEIKSRVKITAVGAIQWKIKQKGGESTPYRQGNSIFILDKGPWIITYKGYGDYTISATLE